MLLDNIQDLSRYNQWMNDKLYSVAAQLDDTELKADRGAFFKSILGTLNHIMVADLLWLKRFADHPARHAALDEVRAAAAPVALDQTLYDSLPTLRARRAELDRLIIAWCGQLTDRDLNHPLNYTNSKGKPFCKHFGSLLLHFFNHQTHHRGQVTTLLAQAGVDVGVTDLLMLIPEQTPGRE